MLIAGHAWDEGLLKKILEQSDLCILPNVEGEKSLHALEPRLTTRNKGLRHSGERGILDIAGFSRKCSGTRPLLPLGSPARASENSPGQARGRSPSGPPGSAFQSIFSSPL